MQSVINGLIEMATYLLKDEMSDPNFKDDKGDTALHWAVLLNNSLLVKFLLGHGVDLTVKNNNGNNAVMIACINQHHEMLSLILETHIPKEFLTKMVSNS